MPPERKHTGGTVHNQSSSPSRRSTSPLLGNPREEAGVFQQGESADYQGQVQHGGPSNLPTSGQWTVSSGSRPGTEMGTPQMPLGTNHTLPGQIQHVPDMGSNPQKSWMDEGRPNIIAGPKYVSSKSFIHQFEEIDSLDPTGAIPSTATLGPGMSSDRS